MWIVCLTDDSHEISSLIFSEKQQKKKKSLLYTLNAKMWFTAFIWSFVY